MLVLPLPKATAGRSLNPRALRDQYRRRHRHPGRPNRLLPPTLVPSRDDSLCRNLHLANCVFVYAVALLFVSILQKILLCTSAYISLFCRGQASSPHNFLNAQNELSYLLLRTRTKTTLLQRDLDGRRMWHLPFLPRRFPLVVPFDNQLPLQPPR